jgi:hypothetical protein
VTGVLTQGFAMGIRAQARVLAKFSLDVEAARIAEVYRGLV